MERSVEKYERTYRGDEEADGDGLLCARHGASLWVLIDAVYYLLLWEYDDLGIGE